MEDGRHYEQCQYLKVINGEWGRENYLILAQIGFEHKKREGTKGATKSGTKTNNGTGK
jgi:hypothetical protein